MLMLSTAINAVKTSLLGTADLFEREHVSESIDIYNQLIQAALVKMRSLNPFTLSNVITLQADKSSYEGPKDLWHLKSHTWGDRNPSPWDDSFVCNIPNVTSSNGKIIFLPAPTHSMINSLGSKFQFFYLANYVLSDDSEVSNVNESLLPLVVLLAQAAAMEMLVARSVSKPVNIKPGAGVTKKSSPAEALDIFMTEAQRISSSQ